MCIVFLIYTHCRLMSRRTICCVFNNFESPIAVLTGTGGRTSKRSLIVRFTVSGQVPCSGAERRSKVLDEVSTAILGGAAAENVNDEQCRIISRIGQNALNSLKANTAQNGTALGICSIILFGAFQKFKCFCIGQILDSS